MPDQIAREGAAWKLRFPVPSANYAASESTIAHPLLVDASGIDGRVRGTIRTFPGFRQLGLGEAYRDTDGSPLGPLIVGPGIFHTDDGNAVAWKHMNMVLWRSPDDGELRRRDRIRFFRSMEFRKSNTNNEVICGFVMLVPYHGPWRAFEEVTYNYGLPTYTTGGVSAEDKYDAVVFFYWDDAPYYCPWVGLTAEFIGPGWRARILSRVWKGYPYDDHRASVYSPEQMDISAEGRFGYIVNPAMFLGYPPYPPWTSYWGSHFLVADEDAGEGPQVLYYNDVDPRDEPGKNYVRLREMRQTLEDVPYPADAETYPQANPRFDTFGLPEVIVGPVKKGGLLIHPGDVGLMRLGVTMWNSNLGKRSEMQTWDVTISPSVELQYVRAYLAIHTSTWEQGYNYLELWRSAVEQKDFMYREALIAMPEEVPAHNSDIDRTDASGGPTDWRCYPIFWGADESEPGTSYDALVVDWMHIDHFSGMMGSQLRAAPFYGGQQDMVATGKSMLGILDQLPFDPIWNFTAPISSTTSRIVVQDQVNYMIEGSGIGRWRWGEWAREDKGLPYTNPALRWSSLVIPNPESFSAMENRWRPDEAGSMIYGLTKVGSTIFIIGTRNLIAVRRLSDRLAIKNVGQNVIPLSSECWCVAGTRLIILAQEALYIVDTATSRVTPVESLHHKIRELDGWGRELLIDSDNVHPLLGMEYDEVGDCIFIWNLNRLECLVYWLKTGFVTSLQDFTWELACSAPLRDLYLATIESEADVFTGGGFKSRAFFVSERGKLETDEQVPQHNEVPWDIFYPDFGDPVRPWIDHSDVTPVVRTEVGSYTMHGCPGDIHQFGSSNSAEWMLNGDVPAAGVHGSAVGGEACINIFAGHTVTPAEIARFQARFVGSIIHLWSPDYRLHFRRLVHWIMPSTTMGADHLTILLWPAFSPSAGTSVEDGYFALAPVVTRVIPQTLTAEKSNVGKWVSIRGLSAMLDPIAVRYISSAWRGSPALGGGVLPLSYRWISTRDAENLKVFAVGYKMPDEPLTDRESYGPNYDPHLVHMLTPYVQTVVDPGRLREIARESLTVSRRLDQAVADVRFGAQEVAVGLEAYPSGVRLELRGVSILGNILPSTRRSV